MTLDFTNYTFSGLVSLLAAILGIGYPMFLESIRKIDEQYRSTRLSAHFQREPVFRGYRCALLVSIVVSFCAPFLLLLFPFPAVSIIVIMLQALAVLWLVFQMLAVFQVIQSYYNPGRLILRLGDPEAPEGNGGINTKEQDIPCLVDLMRFAASRDNADVYSQGKTLLVRMAYQEEAAVKGADYNVSQQLYKAFIMVADYSKDSRNRYFYNDNIVSQSFYNSYFDYHLGPQTYEILWRSVCIVAEGGSDEWFRQHWSSGVQYYTFRYELHPGVAEDESRRFREHHYMLGVLAMYYGRYDWLHFLLFHTHALPAKYPLVPSTFQSIIDAVEHLERQSLPAWQLTQKYQMKDLFDDVRSDDKLLAEATRYAALLLIRLFSVNDYNITYSHPMALPYIEPQSSIYELRNMLERVERLRYQVVRWYEDDMLIPVGLPVLPAQAEVERLLDRYGKAISDQMQYNLDHPVLDTSKMEELKSLLVEADNRMQFSIPSHTPDEYSDVPLQLTIAERLDNDTSAIGGYRGWSNYPDVLVDILNHKVHAYYEGLFSLIPTEVYTINEHNVFKALSMLSLTGSHVILAMGVYLPHLDMVTGTQARLRYENSKVYYNETEVLSSSTDQSSLIIISKSMVPTLTFLPPSEDMQQSSLIELDGSATHLCSNIDQVIADGKPAPVVRLGRLVQSHIPEEATCVRLVVSKNVDDSMELKRLEQVKG